MVSGNFLIGKGLSLEGFNAFVQPVFEEKGYFVKDKLVIFPNTHYKKLLVSIKGDENLENSINTILIESGIIIGKAQARAIELNSQTSGGEYCPLAYSHEVSKFDHWEKNGEKNICIDKGLYTTLGIYDSDDSASKLFPSIAQEYLLEILETKTEAIKTKIKNLLGSKLSELE